MTYDWQAKSLYNYGSAGSNGYTVLMDECEGDCDSDSDCAGDLLCFQRSDSTKVPGCKSGGDDDVSGYDYCYDSSSTSADTTDQYDARRVNDTAYRTVNASGVYELFLSLPALDDSKPCWPRADNFSVVVRHAGGESRV